MRHFAHNIGDYAAATAHLSFVEDAAYHRCLRRYYQDERPLPPDLAAVARLVGARTKDERQAVANVLSEFFVLDQDGYHQKRADREIEIYRAKADAARENGTKGGRPPNQRKTDPVSTPVQSEKLTTPHSPLTNSDPNGSESVRATNRKPSDGKSGTRLPDDWHASATLRDYAASRGLNVDETIEAFCDWWRAANGPGATKRDWDAAFRTWCRRSGSQDAASPRQPRAIQPPRGNDAFYEQLAAIANRDGR